METRRALALAFVLLALPGWAAAGPAPAGSASVTVVVRDGYGVVPGATVRLTNADTDESRRLATDHAGTASFAGLEAGRYLARTSMAGFADSALTVSVADGETRTVEAVLSQVRFSDAVTVTTANRREELLLEVAEPTTLIDETQILDTGSRTAKDLLVQHSGSGIQVNAGGGQGHVSINGVPNSGVMVLVDGHRFLGRTANGAFNLEELPMAGIERVEVVKGPGSALYGADALGGVINFVTRKARHPGWRNSLGLSAGSYGDYAVHDHLAHRGGRLGVSAFGSWRTYDGYDLEPNPAKPNPQTIGQPGSRSLAGGLSADFRVSSRLTARLFADLSDRHVDPYYFSGATQQASTVYNSVRDLVRQTISPSLDFTPAPDLAFSLSYTSGRYLRDETQHYLVGGRVVPQAPWREWNGEVAATGRFAWEAFGQRHTLQAGFERRNEKLRRGSLSVTDPERDITVFWAQQELNLGPRVKLVAGFRSDDYSDFGNEISPKGSLLVDVGRGHRLKASVGEGFRAPQFGELYLRTPPFFVGNPDLRPEKNRPGWTAGYAYGSSRAQVSADYFHNDLEDGIVFDLTRVPYTYGNLSRLVSRGVNATAALSLPHGFSPSVAYTYTRREDDRGREVGGYPRHSTYATLAWASPRLGLRANLRAELNGDVPPGVTDSSYQPAYDIWSLQASKTVGNLGPYSVRLWAQVSNALDEQDVYARRHCPATGAPAGCVEGEPLVGEVLPVWIAPRTFQGGVTVDMDWTR